MSFEDVVDYARRALQQDGIVSGTALTNGLDAGLLAFLPQKGKVKAIVARSNGAWKCVDNVVIDVAQVRNRAMKRIASGFREPQDIISCNFPLSKSTCSHILQCLELDDGNEGILFVEDQVGELVLQEGPKWYILPSNMDVKTCSRKDLFFVLSSKSHFPGGNMAKVGDRVLFQPSALPPNPNPIATNVRLLNSTSCRESGPSNPSAENKTPNSSTPTSRSVPNAHSDLQLDETKSGCVLFIDLSNLWISGRKESAHREGLVRGGRDTDPLWRFNLERLVETILCSGAVGSQPRELIFASVVCSGVGPPHQQIMNDLHMVRFNVSHFSGREKEVDHYIVRIMAKDIGARMALAKHSPHLPRVNRTFCLVSGDRDFLGVVEDSIQAGDCVEMWSFSHALSKSYLALSKRCSQIRAFPLEAFMDRFGYRQTTIARKDLPLECTAVLVSNDGLEKGVAEFIKVTLQYVSASTGCPFQVHSSGRATFIALIDASFQDFCSAMEKFRAMATVCNGAVQAFTLQEYETMERSSFKNDMNDHSETSNRFHSLPGLQFLSVDVEVENPSMLDVMKDHENESFSTFKGANSRPRSSSPLSPKRCRSREFCREGVSCRKLHSKSEYDLFLKSGGTSPYKTLKYIECAQFGCHKGTKIREKCTFLHSTDGEPRLCTRCLRIGCGTDCELISNVRELISDQELQALRAARYMQ